MAILAVFSFLQASFLSPIGKISEEVKEWEPPDRETASSQKPPLLYLKLILDKLEHEPWFRRLQAKENSLAAQANFVELIWQRIRNQYASGKTSLTLLGIYLLFLSSVLPVLNMWLRGINF